MYSLMHIFCIILSVFVCPIYVHMLKQIRDNKPVASHTLVLSLFVFLFVSLVVRNMY